MTQWGPVIQVLPLLTQIPRRWGPVPKPPSPSTGRVYITPPKFSLGEGAERKVLRLIPSLCLQVSGSAPM